LNLFKAKSVFIDVDTYEIMNNGNKLSTEQIKKLAQSCKNHGIDINSQSLINYNAKKPVNKEYKSISYLNV
jgi:hypothetical protein